MRSLLVGVLLAITACKASDPDCARAAAHAVVVSEPGLREIPGMQSRLPAMTDALRTRCTEDGWAPAVRGCIVEAKREADLQACQDTLTSEQQAALRRAMMEAIGRGGGGGGGGGGGPAQ